MQLFTTLFKCITAVLLTLHTVFMREAQPLQFKCQSVLGQDTVPQTAPDGSSINVWVQVALTTWYPLPPAGELVHVVNPMKGSVREKSLRKCTPFIHHLLGKSSLHPKLQSAHSDYEVNKYYCFCVSGCWFNCLLIWKQLKCIDFSGLFLDVLHL